MHAQYGEAEKVMSQVPPHASLVALYNVFGSVLNARKSRAMGTSRDELREGGGVRAVGASGSFEALAALAIKMGKTRKNTNTGARRFSGSLKQIEIPSSRQHWQRIVWR